MDNDLFPIVQHIDLRSNQGMIAILWAIRQGGGTSYAQLYKMVFGQEADESPQEYRTVTLNIQQVFAFHNILVELYRNGAIETTTDMTDDEIIRTFQIGDPISAVKIKEIHIAKRMAFMQHIFNISMSEIVTRGMPMKIYPVFGEPVEHKSTGWSDIFVIMPFLEQLKEVYEQAILPTAKKVKMTCRRGDDFFSSDRIMDEVWAAIYHSKVCIADCTGRNPNVFYELGIAHTLGRPSILIAHKIEEIPFDIRDRRIIIYDDTPEGMTELGNALEKTIIAELDETYRNK